MIGCEYMNVWVFEEESASTGCIKKMKSLKDLVEFIDSIHKRTLSDERYICVSTVKDFIAMHNDEESIKKIKKLGIDKCELIIGVNL